MRRMRRALATMITLGLMVNVGSALALDCQDLLASKRYRCDFKRESGGDFTACFQFTSPAPGALTKLALSADSELATDYICTCKATGSFKNPNFNNSKEFICGNDAYGDSVEGKVNGSGAKILKGQYLFKANPDRAEVFQCVEDSDC